ncbi:uncharacterized protein LOC131998581 [Stomoxys calcitrans]|uniref:uncharacterized protein LOC131998581 n=1 Tax=Stomoxys calcitrans TaxID=35570 RepID=UPI0027E3678D|nr:uncharacterized protein LOC131998581 [Stomoxys calcitrans]XP_059227066.1 uncharacterized protein LOC131998581 [Stomoxys calcitrans]
MEIFFNVMSFVGRAEEIQTQETTANIFLEIESESNSANNSASSSLSTLPPMSTPLRPQHSTVQSAITQIAETMREIAMKERNQNVLDPNISFANYLLSELKTLSDNGAASVRKKVTLYFLQCVEEERNNQFQ